MTSDKAWRGQYRCTMHTRTDTKGREWQGEECFWFSGATHGVPAGAFARLGRPANAGWWKRHLGDSLAHLGGTSLDAASSWRRQELHPLLRDPRGEFGPRGLSIKLAIFGGVEAAKWLALRNPERRNSKLVRAMSLVPAGVFVGAAGSNWGRR